MKRTILIATALAFAGLPGLWANTAPTVVIQSATMRPGTTLMDIVFRVNDPDDATVKTRALAFKDGVRSFDSVIRPTTFVEGTGNKIGDAIPANANHTITWDVAADWDVQLGQVKFEVLAMDGRGLLPLEWLTIPAADGKAEITISKNAPTDTELLNALFWQFAGPNSDLNFTGARLTGTATSGVFDGVELASETSIGSYAAPYIFKQMNFGPADISEVLYAENAILSSLKNSGWRAFMRPYEELSILTGWGFNEDGRITIPSGLIGVVAIAAGAVHSLALKSDGTVVGWGSNSHGQTTIPSGLSGVTAIAAGDEFYSLALKSDGTVVGWGWNGYGQTTIPSELSGVTAIAAGGFHSLALKSNGTVVGWGANWSGQTTIPSGLNGVVSIAAGDAHSLALKSNGTVVGWGSNTNGQTTIPSGLNGVVSIAAGDAHSLALKSDGTVVGWGWNGSGQTTIPGRLNGVISIAAGNSYSLGLKAKAP